MFPVVLLAFALFLPQAAKAVAMPDTPQGKHLQAYLDAFNSGDEKKYLAMMEEHFTPALLAKRPVEERVKLFQRMRGDFGTLKVSSVGKATAERIELGVPDKEGTVATFSFNFEPTAPFRIASLGIEIDKGER